MKDNLKFKSLTELASALSQKLELLADGRLSTNELEILTAESRELYERLVVLRFKAYDTEVKGVTVIPSPVEEVQEVVQEISEEEVTEAMPQIAFRLDEPKVETPVQVSLIDAIEEVVKAEESISPFVKSEVTQEEVAAPLNTGSPLQNEKVESLHDRLTRSLGNAESLADKLEHHPISDLKRAITLNQRFQFSRELFKGNNQDYEVAIDKLNTSNREDAMRHLESLRSKYAWNNESPVATDFVGLVERRHQ